MIKRIFCSSIILCWVSAVGQNQISEILNYDEQVEKISIEKEKIAFVDLGSGEKTLMFIHGLSSNLESWNKNISGLKDEYRCIALDLPGYGKSTKNSTAYSLKDYADFLNSFIEKKNLQDVILIGHSMGGQVAVQTVLAAQDNFEKLILIAPAGIETFSEDEVKLMKASYNAAIVENSSPEQIRNNFKMNFYQFPEDAEFMIKDRIAMKEAEDMKIYAEVVVNNIYAMLDEPVIDRLSEIQIPVLMIYGKNDLLIPNTYFHPSQDISSLVQDAEERISDLKVKLIDAAGHFVNFEKSGEVNEEIAEFLKN
ncbi:alpha/beta fold hydrolase [Psychroflexus sediminis]|uniref:Pimeloyl-ACP methyl ester carboxylesterase n=1 Tax=Psychroflexus sediminis TaxID=470826 RepID=A0A1G7W6Z7_9FLAO|nr:alpha/beta hydrolase [Psychroflexus sediminis]SDG67752.1 Pimeloyl-ACP methyl ester carboxylesterase [Psychroflexus sediminis]